jgi:putative resolvase
LKKKLAFSPSTSKYIPPRVAVKQYGISRTTLANWAKEGKIRAIRLGEGHTSGHRYNEDDLRIHLNIKDAPGEVRKRYTILYARVSSPKQKAAGDLDRQIELLNQEFPNHDKVISDVASGLNFKRKGLITITLLDLVEKGHVADIVVSYRDRLARFGVRSH